MERKALLLIAATFLTTIVIGVFMMRYLSEHDKPVALFPAKKVVKQAKNSEVGIGWSTEGDPEKAVTEAVQMARQGGDNRAPDLVIMFATSHSDMTGILRRARELLGPDTKIYGGTSDSRAVMTSQGFVSAARKGYDYQPDEPHRALAIMTIRSPLIKFGVGSTNCKEYSSPQEASIAATRKAIATADVQESDHPRVVLLTAPRGLEEETLEGIEEVLGKNTPILGGTAGGPVFQVFGQNEVYDVGVSLVAIYTDLPIGWCFEGGFDVWDKHAGIVTRVEGQEICEIDNRPALDVYNEWLDGHIDRLYDQVGDIGKIRVLLTLHPIYRLFTSPSGQDYFLFSHPWPKDPTLSNRSVLTSNKIRPGEKIHISHGQWETFLNRIGTLPAKARLDSDISPESRPLFSLGYICAGVMGVIPEAEREKMPFLINHMNDDVPFIAPITWGEQGYFPGIGNKHGNLLTSFVVVGGRNK